MPAWYDDWENKRDSRKKSHKKLLQKLKRKDSKQIDRLTGELHEEVFEEIDCLQCANCCKTISPIVRDTDMRRIASHLKMKESEVVDRYMLNDPDGHYVMNAAPCPFLGSDNYCSIYEARPKACRDYPHTDHQPFTSINSLHSRNSAGCPAVFMVLERMEELVNG